MKTIDLTQRRWSIEELLQSARSEPLLLVEPSGAEFVLSSAEPLDDEVAALRASPSFQAFLDARSAPQATRSLSDYMLELEQEV